MNQNHTKLPSHTHIRHKLKCPSEEQACTQCSFFLSFHERRAGLLIHDVFLAQARSESLMQLIGSACHPQGILAEPPVYGGGPFSPFSRRMSTRESGGGQPKCACRMQSSLFSAPASIP
mmetsp:Transcript_15935/g.26498  ORF Transcript_15935/g.26498 Transcript_15935/m.26498 type:complete len:119 (+) Transcript_15935:303-659(+)